MIKKGIHIALIILVCVITDAKSQHLPQFSQYNFNRYVINPAVGGTERFFDVRTNHRYQWVGITDAPRTFTLSVNGPSKNQKMGYGGYVFTDVVGPTRRLGAQISYAYKLILKDDLKLSMSISAGVLQFLIDGGKIIFSDPGDDVLSDQLVSATVPDIKFGLYLYSDTYFFGFTSPQLLQSKLSFFDQETNTLSKLEDHYYLMGGYKFNINDDFDVEPSFLFKYVSPVPPKVDINVRAIYRDMVWLGGGYRTGDALSAMIGYTHRKNLTIGYSYDFTTTSLKRYALGTHELMLGIKINPD